MALDTNALRHHFLEYFRAQHHKLIPACSVIAADDPTLLFTNAGMNQFKDHFLSRSIPSDLSVASCQVCMRAGGKHNDLENVGHTKRHLTLFEMLGNFSFGSYFKRQAIDYAWQVATEVFLFDPKRIYPTVLGSDEEAYQLWSTHVPEDRITRMGRAENFWTMGAVGPCGPCSELLYDRGPAFGPAPTPAEDKSGERFLEFWNLVFMQNKMETDGTLTPLATPMIDTGVGLERIAMLKMGVDSVFETDILRALIRCVESIVKIPYGSNSMLDSSMRVIADHCRSIAFCIADRAYPSNVEQGYVVRKLMRRAMRYGKSLGLKEPFLGRVLPAVAQLMGHAYPRLIRAQGEIEQIAMQEELAFSKTLERGGRQFADLAKVALAEKRSLSGLEIFTLKDTHGLPIEEIAYLADDAGLAFDEPSFRDLDSAAKELAQKNARQIHKKADHPTDTIWHQLFETEGATSFCGYETLALGTSALAIVVDQKIQNRMAEGQKGSIAVKKSPFYSESGGQVGDRGDLIGPNGQFLVYDTQLINQIIVHRGEMVRGEIALGETLIAKVDQEARKGASLNHTATHLMDWALGRVLNAPIQQSGSLVEPHKLRYDIKWPRALTIDELDKVQELVNEAIACDIPIFIDQITLEQARQDPEIHQQFGDKYGAIVRLVVAGESKSLCCGTHAKSCSEILAFRIVKESSVGSGVRRIEAMAGRSASSLIRQRENQLFAIAHRLHASPHQILSRLEGLLDDRERLSKEVEVLRDEKRKAFAATYLERATLIKWPRKNLAFHLIIERVDESDLKALADCIAKGPALVVLIRPQLERALIFIRISQDLVRAGMRADALWTHFQGAGFRGKGGADLAQGAGTISAVDGALDTLKQAMQMQIDD